MNLLNNQIEAKSKLLPYKVGALFMEAGTGKTRVAIELVNSVPDVDLVVWVGPLSTIRPKDGYNLKKRFLKGSVTPETLERWIKKSKNYES